MNKKKLLIVVGSLLLVSGAYAVWSNFFTGISGLIITSEAEGGVSYTSYLETENVDTTNNSFEVSDYVELYNNDGNVDIIIDDLTTITDDTNDSCDNTGDTNNTITPSFSMVNGETKRVWINTTIKRWSCPQTKGVLI